MRPGAEPYAHDGDDIGVLLCHGFTSNPASLRPWAESIAAAGHTVRLPRLPGHGTTWQEMAGTRWEDWYAEIDRAYSELRGDPLGHPIDPQAYADMITYNGGQPLRCWA